MRIFHSFLFIFLTTVCIGQRGFANVDASFILDSLDIDVETTVDIVYGDHTRNTFDLFVPQGQAQVPLVIFIHGGGFTHGQKEIAYERYHRGIRKLLENNIAFASINYRFLQHSDDGVISSLKDSKRCLQYIRHHAQSLGIDPEKIASFGESAGAGASLWLALSDDMKNELSDDPIARESTRLHVAGAVSTQSTYNLLRWEEVFSDHNVKFSEIPDFMKNVMVQFYGASNFEELSNEHYTTYRNQLDFFELLSEDDPTLWIQNEGRDGHPLIFDAQHHPLHAAYLKKYADLKGVKNITYAPALDILDPSGENLLEFFLRVFRSKV